MADEPPSRYGKVPYSTCTICGRDGLARTDMHHIIGQTFINERATEKQLRYLAHGLVLEKRLNVDELRKALINDFPRNVTEVCHQCHRMTDSHLAWYDNWAEKQTAESRKHRSRPNIGKQKRDKKKAKYATANQQYRRDNPIHHCAFIKPDGSRCGQKNRKIAEGGYCHYHRKKFGGDPVDYRASPMPPLHGWSEDEWQEPILDGEEMAALVGIHRLGEEVDDYVLELFAEWPEAWRRRWLYLEEW